MVEIFLFCQPVNKQRSFISMVAKQGSESVATKKGEKGKGGKGESRATKRGEKVKGGKGAELHIGYSYLYNTNWLVRAGRRINLPVINVATCVAKVNSHVFSQFLFKFFTKVTSYG